MSGDGPIQANETCEIGFCKKVVYASGNTLEEAMANLENEMDKHKQEEHGR